MHCLPHPTLLSSLQWLPITLFLKISFIYLWLCCVFVALCRLFLPAVSGRSSVVGHRLLTAVASLVQSTGSRHLRFSSCGSWGFVAPRYVGSSWTRGGTNVLCIGRQIPIHCDFLSLLAQAQWWRIGLPMQETQVRIQSPGREDPLGEEIAIHSSILARKIPRTEKPGGLQSMGSQRIGHNWTRRV